MTQVYEVFTKLSMVDGTSATLAIISKEILKLEGGVTKLQGTLTSLNRTSMAVYGGLAALGGTAIMGAFKNIAAHGDKLLDQQDKLQRAGVGLNDVLKLQADYYNRIAKSIPTSTAADYLKTYNELRSVVGAEKAASITPWSLKLESIIANATGKSAEGEGFKLWRAMEMTGRSISDPEGTQKLADAFSKNIIGSGGKLDANTYQTLAKRGGAAWAKSSPEFAAGALSVVAADLGGDTTGTALMSLFMQTSGATAYTAQQAEELARLGLIKKGYLNFNKHGDITSAKPGALIGGEVAMHDPYKWVQNTLMPEMHRIYGNDESAIALSMSKIGRNRNTIRMLTMFSDPGFLEQIAKDKLQWSQAHSIDRSYIDFISRNPKGVHAAFDSQYESMMQSIGAPMMQAAIPVMQGVTDLFTKIGNFANQHPETIEKIGKGMMILGGALVGAGAAAILAALGPAGWIGMGLGAIGTAVALIPKDAWTGLGNGLSLIGKKADELLATLQSWGERFGGWLDGLRTKLMNALGGLWNSFTGLFSKTSLGGQGEGGGGGNAGGMFNGASVIRAATDPVANAASMIGAHERVNNADVQEYLRTGGVGMNPAKTAWCAAFVNASLAKAGIKGTGSAAALSFLNWGSAVNGDAHRGDIFVKNHGGGHGHVGMLTGRFRDGLAEMISGNYGNRVGTSWENLRGGFLRRAFEPPARAAGHMLQVNSAVNIDGHQIASVMTRHLAKFHEHTRQAPYFNGHGMWAGNDIQYSNG